jgi:hypothetical protein
MSILDRRTYVRYTHFFLPPESARSGVPELNDCTDEELIHCGDTLHARACSTQRELLRVIAEVERPDAWQDSGARDMANWVCMRYGISYWKALRWVKAAHALEELPRLSDALAQGELSIDKVVELTRFATQETEGHLIVWAQGVSCRAIREKGDLFHRSLRKPRKPNRPGACPGGSSPRTPGSACLRRCPRPRGLLWPRLWNARPVSSQ